MTNPLMSFIPNQQAVNMQGNPAIQSVKRMMSMLKGSHNPMQALQMLGQQNPQMAQVMNMVNSSGISPKNLFYQTAQQMGVNPSDITNLLM